MLRQAFLSLRCFYQGFSSNPNRVAARVPASAKTGLAPTPSVRYSLFPTPKFQQIVSFISPLNDRRGQYGQPVCHLPCKVRFRTVHHASGLSIIMVGRL